MSYEVMVDLETLGTTPGSAIVTIGAVKFDPSKKQSFKEILLNGVHLKVQMPEKIRRVILEQEDFDVSELRKELPNYHIEESTVQWWQKQEKAARYTTFVDNGISLVEALTEVNKLFIGADRIWSYGYMDPALLAWAFMQEEVPDYLHYRKHCDLRTINTFAGQDMWVAKPRGFIGHNAFHDSAYQAMVLQHVRNS